METLMRCYIPVVDQENAGVVGLSSEQIAEINRINANARYTGNQVLVNLYNSYAELRQAINARMLFIYERTSILGKRMRDAHIVDSSQYINNLICAFLDTPLVNEQGKIRLFMDERIDTTIALDSAKIPNLMQLYSYEIYQLGSLRKISGIM